MAKAASEAAIAVASSTLTCPVCHEIFSHPKILPCTHLVCRQCVEILLEERDHHAACPLCRSLILPVDSQEECDLDLFVDDLATDLVTFAKVEGQKVLEGDDVCVCDRNAMATTFCLQCFAKLCASCTKAHKRLPATQNHQLEELRTLTLDTLLTLRLRSPCPAHPHLTCDLFCPSHQHLICVECSSSSSSSSTSSSSSSSSSSTHQHCLPAVTVAGAAGRKRTELTEQMEKLKEKMGNLDEQIQTQIQNTSSAETSFQNVRDDIQSVFDHLQQKLEARRQELHTQLQHHQAQHRRQTSASRNSLEKQKALTAARSSLIQRLLLVDDVPLLAMCGKLKVGLDVTVEAQQVQEVHEAGGREEVAEVEFDELSCVELTEKIAALGRMTVKMTPLSGVTGRVPRQDSGPCSLCAADVAALDDGDLYTCHECTRVTLACSSCGCPITLRHKDGFQSEMSACPKCGES